MRTRESPVRRAVRAGWMLLPALLAACGGSDSAQTGSAPAITAQPQSVSVIAGQTATFSVVATGAAPLSYQWSLDGVAITGATAASYTTPATAPADSGGLFSVAVSNSAGAITSSNATLTVTTSSGLAITTQPASVTVVRGAPVTFRVVAAGNGPLTYQWRYDGVALNGNPAYTQASFRWDAILSADHGHVVDVVVSDGTTSVTSSPATISVVADALGAASVCYDLNPADGKSMHATYATNPGVETFDVEYRRGVTFEGQVATEQRDVSVWTNVVGNLVYRYEYTTRTYLQFPSSGTIYGLGYTMDEVTDYPNSPNLTRLTHLQYVPTMLDERPLVDVGEVANLVAYYRRSVVLNGVTQPPETGAFGSGWKFEGVETITVPAGTFQTCKWEQSGFRRYELLGHGLVVKMLNKEATRLLINGQPP